MIEWEILQNNQFTNWGWEFLDSNKELLINLNDEIISVPFDKHDYSRKFQSKKTGKMFNFQLLFEGPCKVFYIREFVFEVNFLFKLDFYH